MLCCQECFRAIHKLFVKDERENLRVVLAYVRHERDSLQAQHLSVFRLLFRMLPTANGYDLRQTAQREFELSQRLTILQTTVDNCRVILSSWDNFVSKSRSDEVREAFAGLLSAIDLVSISQLSDWLRRQSGQPRFTEPAPPLRRLEDHEFPQFFADLLIRIGSLTESRDREVRENLRNADLLHDNEF
jgi:hypothetical protein